MDKLISKQMTFVKTVFEDVFQDSLAAEFVKMADSKPHEMWAEIDNAFTTATLDKSANAERKFTNFNRKPGEGLRQFLTRVEGAREMLKDIYGHEVSDLEMIPKLKSALSGEIKTSFITWCRLKGATYRSLRQQLWDRGDDVIQSANVTFNDGFRPRRHPHETNHSLSHTHSHSRSFTPDRHSERGRPSHRGRGGIRRGRYQRPSSAKCDQSPVLTGTQNRNSKPGARELAVALPRARLGLFYTELRVEPRIGGVPPIMISTHTMNVTMYMGGHNMRMRLEDDDGESVDSHYSDTDHEHSNYEENICACHEER